MKETIFFFLSLHFVAAEGCFYKVILFHFFLFKVKEKFKI
jgi:hypothetical protein